MTRIHIRQLGTLEEYRACEEIQKSVWGGLGVGSEVLSVTAKYGGVVLGALAGVKVVGFIYAFLARRHGRLIHWSHMMAVAEPYRDQGLGFRMKLAHRRLALAQGINSICWTYDPLQSRNARLNIGRLGGVVEQYIVNCYGRFPSRIERGLPSDRFVVDWRIGSANVAKRVTGWNPASSGLISLPRVNETRPNPRGFVENCKFHFSLRAPRLAVEIPANTDAIRGRDLRLAERWRLEARKIFRYCFSQGYRVIDFIPPCRETCGRCFYVLGHKTAGS